MFSLICVWINGGVNNRKAGDLRRHRGHYNVKVMINPVNWVVIGSGVSLFHKQCQAVAYATASSSISYSALFCHPYRHSFGCASLCLIVKLIGRIKYLAWLDLNLPDILLIVLLQTLPFNKVLLKVSSAKHSVQASRCFVTVFNASINYECLHPFLYTFNI